MLLISPSSLRMDWRILVIDRKKKNESTMSKRTERQISKARKRLTELPHWVTNIYNTFNDILYELTYIIYTHTVLLLT